MSQGWGGNGGDGGDDGDECAECAKTKKDCPNYRSFCQQVLQEALLFSVMLLVFSFFDILIRFFQV